MKRIRLIALISVLISAFSVSAEIIEQWKFEGPNPEKGVNGLTINTWSASSPNNLMSPKILRYGSPGKSNSVQLGKISTSGISKLVMTIMAKDIFLGTDGNTTDQIIFQIGTNAGNLELEFNVYKNSDLTIDLEQGTGSDEDLDVTLLKKAQHLAPSPLVMVATWDFIEGSMSFESKGASGVRGTSKAANLKKIKTLNSFRINGGKMTHGTFIDLYSVTIETSSVKGQIKLSD